MKGILKGLQTAAQYLREEELWNNSRSIVLLSDSQGCLRKLQTAYQRGVHKLSLIDDIQRNIADALEANPDRVIILQWIEAHKGRLGNERADELAKEGAREPPAEFSLPLEISKRVIKQQSRKTWKKKWQDSDHCRQLFHHMKQHNPKDPANLMTNTNKCVIHKLRMNVFDTREFKFFGLSVADREHTSRNCSCGSRETVEHMLITCANTSRARRFCWNRRNPTIERALFGSKEDLQRTIDFLRCTDRL